MTSDHCSGLDPLLGTTAKRLPVAPGDRARRRLPALLITFLLPVAGLAAGDPGACRDIADADARLACYDRALGVEAAAPDRTGETGRDPVGSAARNPESRRPDAGSRPERSVSEPSLPVSRADSDPAAAAPSRDAAAAAPQAGAPTRITEIRTTSLGRQRFHLANGEVWERTGLDRVSTLAVGDGVVVGQTLFGSHFLREQAGHKRSVKVRRLD